MFSLHARVTLTNGRMLQGLWWGSLSAPSVVSLSSVWSLLSSTDGESFGNYNAIIMTFTISLTMSTNGSSNSRPYHHFHYHHSHRTIYRNCPGKSSSLSFLLSSFRSFPRSPLQSSPWPLFFPSLSREPPVHHRLYSYSYPPLFYPENLQFITDSTHTLTLLFSVQRTSSSSQTVLVLLPSFSLPREPPVHHRLCSYSYPPLLCPENLQFITDCTNILTLLFSVQGTSSSSQL